MRGNCKATKKEERQVMTVIVFFQCGVLFL